MTHIKHMTETEQRAHAAHICGRWRKAEQRGFDCHVAAQYNKQALIAEVLKRRGFDFGDFPQTVKKTVDILHCTAHWRHDALSHLIVTEWRRLHGALDHLLIEAAERKDKLVFDEILKYAAMQDDELKRLLEFQRQKSAKSRGNDPGFEKLIMVMDVCKDRPFFQPWVDNALDFGAIHKDGEEIDLYLRYGARRGICPGV